MMDDEKLGLYPCHCGSVWCPKCATYSKTHKAIQERMAEMDWRKVRHVILTTDRRAPAAATYDAIRISKSIPRLVRALKLQTSKWLWILEWHADGYPHWHLLIESPDGMIGHRRIRSEWVWGHVWESYIQSEDHWRRIMGYHRSKGYLAGEQKGHQLSLPEHLMDRCRVRKFGGHQRKNVPRGTSSGYCKKRARSGSYESRFKACGESTRANVCGQWTEIPVESGTARTLADRYLCEHNRCEYRADPESIAYVIKEIMAMTRDPGPET